MAQGANRVARGRAYTDYIRQNYGAQPTVMLIPRCGHSARCMFTADAALPVLVSAALTSSDVVIGADDAVDTG